MLDQQGALKEEWKTVREWEVKREGERGERERRESKSYRNRNRNVSESERVRKNEWKKYRISKTWMLDTNR